MTGESQNKPLHGMRVSFSGAVPEPKVRQEHKASEYDILEIVRRLAERVLASGGNIVYGSHPHFTEVIDGVAEGLFPEQQPDRIHMYVSRRYVFPQPESIDPEERYPLLTQGQYEEKHGRFARIHWVGAPDASRKDALGELREAFVSEADALICIGGKGPREGKVPGVEAEANIAVCQSKPVFLIARTGGHTQTLRETWKQRGLLQARLKSNGLTAEENEKLAEPVQPSLPIPSGERADRLSEPSLTTTADVIDLVLKGLSEIYKR